MAHQHQHNHAHESSSAPLARIIAATAMLLCGIAASQLCPTLFASAPWAEALWYTAAFLLIGWNVVREAIEEARGGDAFSEQMLMSVAAVGALLTGEYPEAVAVVLLYEVGEALQDRAVDRARDNIRSLMALRPDKATIEQADGQTLSTSPENVSVGQTIVVRAGERVPLDGTLQSGAMAFDTAALTGESQPRTIDTSGEVLAGMIAVGQTARIVVSRPASSSAVARILSMVEDATARKAPTELFIRRFAHVYTPVVMALAVLVVVVPWLVAAVVGTYVYDFTTWFHRALVLLVISCPCALVISIPLGYFAGIGAASRRGILFKGGGSIDTLCRVDTVAFDKTGTLTTGRFSVAQAEGITTETLSVVAAMEQTSSHPIAEAIVAYAAKQGVRADAIGDVHNVAGYGLTYGDWLVGTPRLLDEHHVGVPEDVRQADGTLVVVAHQGRYVGHLLLADTPKGDAVEAIHSLSPCRTEILSGDRQSLVSALANRLHADQAMGDLLPEQKARHIGRLQEQGRVVAFVGDGINDAPVLAQSDVGIAMGAMGSDAAVETADVVIQTDHPSKVAEAIAISRRTQHIIRQNIVLAIGFKALIMLLGVLGWANLWLAVAADSGVALVAVLNAVRIFRVKKGCQ